MERITNSLDVKLFCERAREKGHTYVEYKEEGHYPAREKLEKFAERDHHFPRVIFAYSGYPEYANYNRHKYEPMVVGVSVQPNNSAGSEFRAFLNS